MALYTGHNYIDHNYIGHNYIGALEARLYRELTPAMMRALSYTSTQVEAWKSSHGHVETDGEGVYRGYVLRYADGAALLARAQTYRP